MNGADALWGRESIGAMRQERLLSGGGNRLDTETTRASVPRAGQVAGYLSSEATETTIEARFVTHHRRPEA